MPIRPLRDDDLPAVLPLLALTPPAPATADDFRRMEATWPPEQARERWVLEEGGEVVATAVLFWWPFIAPDARQGSVLVREDARGRGHGAALLAHLEARARAAGAAFLLGNVRDTDPASRDWAERRGFALDVHRFASELDLTAFDGARFAGQGAPEGVAFRTMEGAPEEDWERFVAFYGDLLAQTPDLAGLPRWTRAQIDDVLRDRPSARPDWMFVAEDAATGRPLGLTVLTDFPKMAYNELTGVAPEARGRGLALALKLRAIEAARREGRPLMRTNNLSTNAPMLAVNRKLGFVALPGNWLMKRALG